MHGDLHDPATVAEVGPHEVVWCSGVLYHAPNPVLTLQRLRELTTELLILQTMTLPELPGVKQGLVFYPGVPDREPVRALGRGRRAVACGCRSRARTRTRRGGGGSRSRRSHAMLRAAGFEPVEQWGDPFAVHVIARPV